MTPEQVKLFRPILDAFEAGKTIEVCYGGTWYNVLNLALTRNPEQYRIKQEPIKIKIWVHRVQRLSQSYVNGCNEYQWKANGWEVVELTIPEKS